MSQDLFPPPGGLTRLPIPDADVYFADAVPLGVPAESALQRLVDETPWRSESIVVWGKRHPQPRLTAWYGDPGAIYSYSGIRLVPLPWTCTLRLIKESVERLAGAAFNSVLANYYRTERDSMGWHSDDEPELGPEPTIASVSFGAPRTFVLRHKSDDHRPTVRLRLCAGSVLIMKGATQRCWRHAVPKQTRAAGPRVNLTFRSIVR